MRFRLLHLSDLHLGNDVVIRSLLKGRSWRHDVSEAVSLGLTAAIRELAPSYVIVSGDVVNKPKSKIFLRSADYLRTIFSNAGLDFRQRVLIVPGNHDVSFFPKKEPDDWKRLMKYRTFLRHFYGETDIEARRTRYSRVDAEKKLILFCLDSTLKSHKPLAEGELGESQREWINAKMKRIESQLGAGAKQFVKIAVLHHHCIQIPGTGSRGERFMQLLDGADTLKLFDKLGFQVVLHGHKHVPHCHQMQVRSDTSSLTIVGAGTATCPILEEQAGYGNNFNVLDFDLERNQLAVRLYQANGDGRFCAAGSAQKYSLFRKQASGYCIDEVRKIVRLDASGDIRTSMEKKNFRVEEAGKDLYYVDLRVDAQPKGAEILEFQPHSSSSGAKFKADVVEQTRIEGKWFLNTPLRVGSPGVTTSYSYLLRNGTAMTKKQRFLLYGEEGDTERTSVIVSNPVNKLRLELNLPTAPRRFVTEIWTEVEHLGQKHAPEKFGCRTSYDQLANRYELEVDHPPQNYRFSIYWRLPEEWS